MIFPKPARTARGEWVSRPDSLYHDQWYLVSPEQEVLATVRRYKDDPWQAYIKENACRSGQFMTKEAAIAAIEADLR